MTSDSAAATPTLEQLTVNHAPVQFPTSATAVTVPIGPPTDVPDYVGRPRRLMRHRGRRRPHRRGARRRRCHGGPGAAPHRDRATIPLAGVAAPGSKLVAVLGFTGDGVTTAKVKNLTATYTTTTTPSQLTLTAGKTLLPYGGSTTLTGRLVSDPTPPTRRTGTSRPWVPSWSSSAQRRRHDGLHGARQCHYRARRLVLPAESRQAAGDDELPRHLGRRHRRCGHVSTGRRLCPGPGEAEGDPGAHQVQQEERQVLPLQVRPDGVRQGRDDAEPRQARGRRDGGHGHRDRLPVQVAQVGQSEERRADPERHEHLPLVLAAEVQMHYRWATASPGMWTTSPRSVRSAT